MTSQLVGIHADTWNPTAGTVLTVDERHGAGLVTAGLAEELPATSPGGARETRTTTAPEKRGPGRPRKNQGA